MKGIADQVRNGDVQNFFLDPDNFVMKHVYM